MIAYCYVVGTARSGSTLLSRLLHAHPELGTTGEMNGPNRAKDRASYPCSCGSEIAVCGFFVQLLGSMRERGLQADLDHWPGVFTLEDDWYRNRHPILNRLSLQGLRSDVLENARDRLLSGWARRKHAIARASRATVAYAEIGLELLGKRRVWVDATKEPIRLSHLVRVPELDLYAIHLVRDPRGYVNSMRKTGQPEWSKSASEWTWNARNAQRAMRRLPESRRMVLRYESLVDDPVASINAIAKFLGVRGHDSYDFQAGGHHLIGNRMRLHDMRELRRDERWKADLSADALREIARIVGPEARAYGYDL
jgi:sulfotransferase family protein